MSFRPVLVLSLALASTVPATAQDDRLYTEPKTSINGIGQPDWIITLKATGVVTPKFEGGEKYGPSAYPGVSFRRPGQSWKFGAPDDGFGITLWDTTVFQIGPVARIRPERDRHTQKNLRGLDKIEWAVEPGVFVEFYAMEALRFRAELRHGVNGHHGFVGDLAADYIQKYDRSTVSIGPRVGFGDNKFMDTYFGVSGDDAADNGRVRRYNPKGGVRSVGVAAAYTYDWTDNWSTTAFGSYNRMVGEAADSPIVRKLGSKDQLTVGLGLAYSFGVEW